APAEVPNGADDIAGRRRIDLAEQDPTFLRPDCIYQAGEPGFLGVELASVELDRCFWIGGIQMQVVEMRSRHRLRQRACGRKHRNDPKCGASSPGHSRHYTL